MYLIIVYLWYSLHKYSGLSGHLALGPMDSPEDRPEPRPEPRPEIQTWKPQHRGNRLIVNSET